MHQRLALLAGCLLTGAIALGIGWAWLAVTGAATIPVPVDIVAALASVVLALLIEDAARAVLRRRTRPSPARHGKTAV